MRVNDETTSNETKVQTEKSTKYLKTQLLLDNANYYQVVPLQRGSSSKSNNVKMVDIQHI